MRKGGKSLLRACSSHYNTGKTSFRFYNNAIVCFTHGHKNKFALYSQALKFYEHITLVYMELTNALNMAIQCKSNAP